MKKISHSFLLAWSVGAFLLAATDLRAEVTYPPGNFDLEITLGCNCTCFCPTNMAVTNTPIGAFLATNGVSFVSGTSALSAPAVGTQYIPPHWALLGSSQSMELNFEGWTQTRTAPSGAGGGSQTIAPPGNFTQPIGNVLIGFP